MFEKPQIITPALLDQIKEAKQPKMVDIYNLQIKELQRISNPSGAENIDVEKLEAVHIYYPWLQTVARCVGEKEYFALRTNRNRELVSTDEQEVLRTGVVGVAGMSVGSGIAIGLSYSGISQHIKIADHDELDTSNLNRLRESLLHVGRPKVELAAERIYEVDPFANVELFANGINADNIDDFFHGLQIVIDEIDDFKMKVQLRLHAKKHKIPLLMLTSLGDNILIDVERYDLDPNQQIFNGLLGNNGEEILNKADITPDDIRKYSVQLVGQEYIPTKALKSVTEMGKTLVGRPQLYSTIAVDGGLAIYLVRRLLLGQELPAGRYFVEFAKLVGLPNTDLEQNEERTEMLNRLFGQ